MIYQIYDAMMSLWDRLHFWLYLLKHNSLRHQTWPVDRYKLEKKFPGSFWTTWRTGGKLQVFLQLSNLLQLLNNQLCQDSSVLFFEKGEQETIKNGQY